MLISGALLPQRGALFQGLQSIGLSEQVTRRAWAAFRGEVWQTAILLRLWHEQIEGLPGWRVHRHEGYRGLSPIQAHPELLQPRHSFQPEHELALSNLQAVDAYLATLVWQRKVGLTGQITMSGAHERYSVGRAYARQQVLVRFDPLDRHYVFFLPSNPETEIGRMPARNLDIADLTGIQPWPIGVGFQQFLLPLPFFQEVFC